MKKINLKIVFVIIFALGLVSAWLLWSKSLAQVVLDARAVCKEEHQHQQGYSGFIFKMLYPMKKVQDARELDRFTHKYPFFIGEKFFTFLETCRHDEQTSPTFLSYEISWSQRDLLWFFQSKVNLVHSFWSNWFHQPK